jgi:hypothetical protein
MKRKDANRPLAGCNGEDGKRSAQRCQGQAEGSRLGVRWRYRAKSAGGAYGLQGGTLVQARQQSAKVQPPQRVREGAGGATSEESPQRFQRPKARSVSGGQSPAGKQA